MLVRSVTSSPGEAVVALDGALAEWRGASLAEFADTPLGTGRGGAFLDELRLVALELRDETSGSPTARSERPSPSWRASFESILGVSSCWDYAVLALHRSGRQGEALRAGQTLRRRLHDELGLEPSSMFCDLERSIIIADQSLIPLPSGAPRPPDNPSRPAGATVPASSDWSGTPGDLDIAR